MCALSHQFLFWQNSAVGIVYCYKILCPNPIWSFMIAVFSILSFVGNVTFICLHWHGSGSSQCNSLKFAPFEIDINWVNFKFLCSWKHREIIIFIKLKFVIMSSNMDVHTCRCIWSVVMSGWIPKCKINSKCFWKWN